jgi:SAM-dependent methyltransferase
MLAIETFHPNWRDLKIHESSPSNRGVSLKLMAECPGYQSTQYHPNLAPGSLHPIDHWRCENLESQTFPSEQFDLVITQDVFEHIFNPEKAFAEIYRTLKPNAAMISTTPLVYGDNPTVQCAKLSEKGDVIHILQADYHKNPVDERGSLVTFYWGKDIRERIDQSAPFKTQIIDFTSDFQGIEGPLVEVIVSSKRG